MIFSGCKKNIEPTVKFINPESNLVIKKDTTLTIEVEANDVDGIVESVNLFIDDNLTKAYTESPYTYEWKIISNDNIGEHIIKAIACDNDGDCKEESIKINIIGYTNYKPEVNIIKPNNNLVLERDTTLTIEISAIDEDGIIESVKLIIDDELVKNFTEPPYEYDWEIIASENIGEHIIKAIACDNEGDCSESNINIKVADYREKYYGKYDFKVVYRAGIMEDPPVFTYDTTYYTGFIKEFQKEDIETNMNYLFHHYDYDPNKIITINFRHNFNILPCINNLGEFDDDFVSKPYVYYHKGNFIGNDSISFEANNVYGGAWEKYIVSGKKILD